MWYLDESRLQEDYGRTALIRAACVLERAPERLWVELDEVRTGWSQPYKPWREIAIGDRRLSLLESDLSPLHGRVDNIEGIDLKFAREIYRSAYHQAFQTMSIGIDPKARMLEFIPVQAKAKEVNLLDKLGRTFELVLARPLSGRRAFKRNQEVVEAFIAELGNEASEEIFDEMFEHDAMWSGIQESRQIVLRELVKELKSSEYLYQINARKGVKLNPVLCRKEAIAHKVPQDDAEFFRSDKEKQRGCVFCNKAILEAQEIDRVEDFRLMVNYKPYSYPHFLLIPVKHEEQFFNLSDEMLGRMQAYLEDIVPKLNAHYTGSNFILFLQNGSAGGQTEPHTHIHLLRRPDALGFLLEIAAILTLGIEFGMRQLSPAEMHALKEELRFVLAQPLKADESAYPKIS